MSLFGSKNTPSEETPVYAEPLASSSQTDMPDQFDEVDMASLETRDMIKEVLRLTRENHRILRQQHRAKRLESLRGILRLLAFLAVLVIGFMLAKPYIDGAKRIYNSVADKVEDIGAAAQTIQNTSTQLQQGQSKVQNFFADLKASFETGIQDDKDDWANRFEN